MSAAAASVAHAKCHDEAEGHSKGICHMLEFTMISVHSWLLYEREVQDEGIKYL